MKFNLTIQLAAYVATTDAANRPESAPLNDMVCSLWVCALCLSIFHFVTDLTRMHNKIQDGMLRAFNQVAAKHAYIQQHNGVCGVAQETRHDDDYNAISCGDDAEGGCTCPEGLTKRDTHWASSQ